MKGILPDQNQRELFRPLLCELLNPKHELKLPADRIDWEYFEKEFSPLYAAVGQPSVPIRMTVGCLMLKQRKRVGEILRELCRYKGIEILEAHAMPDHIHMCISVPPKYSIAMTIGYLKGKSAIRIHKELSGR